MDNPHNDSAFLRVMNFPTRGIGAKGQENLQDAARQYGISLYAAVPYLTGKAGSSLAAFVKLIEGARFETQRMPLPGLVQRVLEMSTLINHYQNEKEGADRIENLEQLVNAATLFLAEEGFDRDAPALLGPVATARPGAAMLTDGDDNGTTILDADAALHTLMSPLSAFLSHASLEAGDNQAQAGQDAIQLMTVHSAKGLEFDAVFITGLEEGLFPHENSAKETGGIEEERRLMYVAITRARQRLFMSFAQSRMLHGQIRYNTRSRFLSELPEENVKWLSPQLKQNWASPPKSAWDTPSSYPSSKTYPPARAPGGAPSPLATNKDGWRIGQTVRHDKFGEGIIIKLEGDSSGSRGHIQFYKIGLKILDLSIAKLERD